MTVTRFEEVAVYGEKSVRCAGGCGRRLRRRQRFWRTINPFHTMTREQLQEANIAEMRAWQSEPEWCVHCPLPEEAKP